MKLEDYLAVLRRRWILVVAGVLVGGLVGLIVSLLATPKYVASTRLFVSNPAAADVAAAYEGNLYSQQRVASYTQLITSESLAQRTVDRLGLDMTAAELAKHVKATATPETVLIDVSVEDSVAGRAAEIANAHSEEFTKMVARLEDPYGLEAPSIGGGMTGRAPITRVEIAESATVPQQRVSPQRRMNLLLGDLIGLVVGFGLALLVDRFDKSVRNRSQVESLTGGPVLATVSRHRGPAAVDFDGPSTDAAETYRCLAATIADLEDPLQRVIVVTSPDTSGNRTALAINLGRALAEVGHSVCLVDGDLRTRELSGQFEEVSVPGLNDLLRQGLQPFSPVGFGRLNLLSAGPISARPSELLAGDPLVDVINSLRATFDYVIIDAPPLPRFADAVMISRRADSVMLAVTQDETSRDELDRAVEALHNANATLLGTVIMATPPRRIFRSAKAVCAKDVPTETVAVAEWSVVVQTNGSLPYGGDQNGDQHMPVLSTHRNG